MSFGYQVLGFGSGGAGPVPFLVTSVTGACNSITIDGDYKYATFLGPGDFVVCAAADCTALNAVAYAVVAGGAGGGNLYLNITIPEPPDPETFGAGALGNAFPPPPPPVLTVPETPCGEGTPPAE